MYIYIIIYIYYRKLIYPAFVYRSQVEVAYLLARLNPHLGSVFCASAVVSTAS